MTHACLHTTPRSKAMAVEPVQMSHDKSGQLRRFVMDQTRWVICCVCKRERPPHAVRFEAMVCRDRETRANGTMLEEIELLASTPFWCWPCYERTKPPGAVEITHKAKT